MPKATAGGGASNAWLPGDAPGEAPAPEDAGAQGAGEPQEEAQEPGTALPALPPGGTGD